jgi:hypothetical protein
MANANQPYAYKPLEHSDSIRLIELLPGVQGSWLTCNIIDAQRADSSEYEALSYAWGESILSHKIEEVSRSMYFSITVNLHDALQAIRYEHASRVLWIDAMCINQSDLDEKGHQVASMGKIYGDAWRVVVWLGYHKLAITRIINVLTEIIDGYKECFDANLRPYTRVSRALTRLATSQFLEQPWYVSFPSLCIFLGCSYRDPVLFFFTIVCFSKLIIAGLHVCGWCRSAFSRGICNFNSRMAFCQQSFSRSLLTRSEAWTWLVQGVLILSIHES